MQPMTFRCLAIAGLLPLTGCGTRTATPRVLLSCEGEIVDDVAFSPDGARVYSADNIVRQWDAAGGKLLATATGPGPFACTAIAVSPDSQTFAVGFGDGAIHLYDTSTMTSRQALKGHDDGSVWRLVFDSAGTTLGSASGGQMKIWDLSLGQVQFEVNESNRFGAMDYAPSRGLVAVGAGNAVHLWKLEPRERLREFAHSKTYEVTHLAFSLDGRRMVTTASQDFGGPPGECRVWEVDTGNRLADLKGHTSGLFSAAFSPDGMILVTGDENGNVRVWDAETYTCRSEFRAHTSIVTSLVFHPDARIFASSSYDGTVKLWNVP